MKLLVWAPMTSGPSSSTISFTMALEDLEYIGPSLRNTSRLPRPIGLCSIHLKAIHCICFSHAVSIDVAVQ